MECNIDERDGVSEADESPKVAKRLKFDVKQDRKFDRKEMEMK